MLCCIRKTLRALQKLMRRRRVKRICSWMKVITFSLSSTTKFFWLLFHTSHDGPLAAAQGLHGHFLCGKLFSIFYPPWENKQMDQQWLLMSISNCLLPPFLTIKLISNISPFHHCCLDKEWRAKKKQISVFLVNRFHYFEITVSTSSLLLYFGHLLCMAKCAGLKRTS